MTQADLACHRSNLSIPCAAVSHLQVLRRFEQAPPVSIEGAATVSELAELALGEEQAARPQPVVSQSAYGPECAASDLRLACTDASMVAVVG